MKKAFAILGIVVIAVFFSVDVSRASRPVSKTIVGCVIDGALYSLVEVGAGGARGKRFEVYRMRVVGIDLRPFEGRKISVAGFLSPGDRFHASPESVKTLGPCDRDSRRAIFERTR